MGILMSIITLEKEANGLRLFRGLHGVVLANFFGWVAS
jgi:hypothetical protein